MNAISLISLAVLMFHSATLAMRAMTGQQVEGGMQAVSHKPASDITFPQWLKPLFNLFVDVELHVGFPSEEEVEARIRQDEQQVLSLSSIAILKPGAKRVPLAMSELKEGANENDLDTIAQKTIASVDVQSNMRMLMQPHVDTCQGTDFVPADTPSQIFENIRATIDKFDIFTKCTKTYVPNKVDSIPKIRKDDIIAISTELVPGFFSLSFEDVTQYQEYYELEDFGTGQQMEVRTLVLIVSSRKENVIEGNYDVIVKQYASHVEIKYTKRQNLAEKFLRDRISHSGYAMVTQRSVDKTLRKLAYVGLYGAAALDESDGCYLHTSCTDYGTKKAGEACQTSMQCQSFSCSRQQRQGLSWSYVCD